MTKRNASRRNTPDKKPTPRSPRIEKEHRRARVEFRNASRRFQSGRINAFEAMEVIEDVADPLSPVVRIERGARLNLEW